MASNDNLDKFIATACKVGAVVVETADCAAALAYLRQQATGALLLPPSPSLERLALAEQLRQCGCEVLSENLRASAHTASCGVTGANFAIADTGTVVLESTAEDMRLATTLPEKHFVILDPRKVVADGLAAVPLLRSLQQRHPRSFLAYISGPSRTADIERVLTIGVHGPRELHILLMPGHSGDFLEM